MGLIALLPIQLLINEYFVYEKWIQKKNNLNRNIIINDSNNINNEKNDDLIINPEIENENNIINIKEKKERLNNYKISKEDSFDVIDINLNK